jgi:dCTP deaminase
MSILSDRNILRAIERGEILISPFDAAFMGTNSYDVRLARRLLTYVMNDAKGYRRPLDCRMAPETREILIPEGGIVLQPGELYLGVTVEYTETHRCVPFLEGKSSGGRLGLSIHATAGKGDVGFCGHWTMEITSVIPLRVYAGMPIGQLIYHEASSDPLVSYSAKRTQKYAAGGERSDDPRPVASRMNLNFASGDRRS